MDNQNDGKNIICTANPIWKIIGSIIFFALKKKRKITQNGTHYQNVYYLLAWVAAESPYYYYYVLATWVMNYRPCYA